MQLGSYPFPRRALCGAVLLYSILQITFLGLAAIGGSTEAREAQVVETILREGEWILPLRNGIIPSKPPLFHWVAALLSILLGGVSEFSVRLPSHLFAVGVLVCCALSAYRLACLSRTAESEVHCKRVALLAAAILSLTYGFHQLANQAMVDMSFSFCVWGAIASLLWSNSRDWAAGYGITWQNRALFWVFCAGAVLARGPLGIALPILLVGAVGLRLTGWRVVIRELLRPSLGWLAFLAPIAWYSAACMRGGEGFIERQLLFENVQRFIGGSRVNTKGWFFYIPSLLRTTFPWGALMVLGLFAVQRRFKTVSYPYTAARFATAPFVALLAGVIFFSLSSGKGHSYMLPLLPLVAIQVSLIFSQSMERSGARLPQLIWSGARQAERGLIVTALLLLIATCGAWYGDWSSHPLEDLLKFEVKSSVMRLAVVMTLAATSAVVLRNKAPQMRYASVWILMTVILTTTISFGSVVKSKLKGFESMGEKIRLLANEQQTISFIKDQYDEYFDPILFYLHKPVTILSAATGLAACDPSVVYVARREWFSEFVPHLPGAIRELASLQETMHALNRDGVMEVVVFTCNAAALQNGVIGAEWQEASLRPI